jgi:hypothetical protein
MGGSHLGGYSKTEHMTDIIDVQYGITVAQFLLYLHIAVYAR